MTTFEDVLYKAKTMAEAAGKKTSDMPGGHSSEDGRRGD